MIFARPWLLLLLPPIAAWAAVAPTQKPRRRALTLKMSMSALAAWAVAASQPPTVMEQQEVRS